MQNTKTCPKRMLLPRFIPKQMLLKAKHKLTSEKRKTHLNVGDDFFSINVERHWKRQKKQLVEQHAESGFAAVAGDEAIKECFGSSDLEDNHDSAKCRPSLDKPTKIRTTPYLGDVSEFNGQALYDSHRKIFLINFWGDLKRKILKTPAEFMSSIKEDILSGISSIEKLASDFDLSYLENSLTTLFSQAGAYDEARSASFKSPEVYLQYLKELKQSIRDAKAKKKEDTNKIKSLKDELAELEKQRERLSQSLKEHQASQKTLRKKIKELESELAEQKNTFREEAAKNVDNLRSLLESARAALEDQNPFA